MLTFLSIPEELKFLGTLEEVTWLRSLGLAELSSKIHIHLILNFKFSLLFYFF